MGLHGKVAVVTGAGAGIGRGVALALAQAGADLALLEIDPVKGAAAADAVREHGVHAIAVPCDVSDPDQCNAAIETTVSSFGGVDVLVNDAVPPWLATPFIEQDEKIIRRQWEVGVMGSFYLMRAVYPHMKQRGGGSIINFGSWAGTEGLAGYAGYGAAKEGMRALTKCAAMEWGIDKIRVNNVCPWADSDGAKKFLEDDPQAYAEQLERVPLKRIGDCERDIGRVVAFLADSDVSGYMTANTLMVDGGAGSVR